jgi:imidazolonepropionase-like amidohydrolase
MPNANNYQITGATILKMNGDLVKDHDVFVRDGAILSVQDQTLPPPSGNFQVIDGKGKFLMPGISEMHAHIPVPRDGDDQNVRETLFLYLTNGITTIRGMLGNSYHLELKQMIENNEILSPRVYTSSPSMNGNSVQSPEEASRLVKQYKEDGYDFLKIHPGITLPTMIELVRTADEVGIRFAGHVPIDVGIRNALSFGYWSIDHIDGYIEGMMPEGTDPTKGGFFGSQFARDVDLKQISKLAKETAKQHVWVVPTQSLFTRWISPEPPEQMIQAKEMQYMPARVRYSWVSGKAQILNRDTYSEEDYEVFLDVRQNILRSLHRAGVDFLLGSDAPQVFNVPGFSIQHEMQSLVESGIPIIEILKSGTLNPARFFEEEGAYGEVTKGASADLILLSANPLEKISYMRQIEGVMVRGTWLSRKLIDEELTRIAQRHSE